MRYILALKYRTGSIDSIRLLLQKPDCEYIDEDTIIKYGLLKSNKKDKQKYGKVHKRIFQRRSSRWEMRYSIATMQFAAGHQCFTA